MPGKQTTMIRKIGTLSQWGTDEASTEAKARAATNSTTPRWIGLIPNPQKSLRLLVPAIGLLTCVGQPCTHLVRATLPLLLGGTRPWTGAVTWATVTEPGRLPRHGDARHGHREVPQEAAGMCLQRQIPPM